MSDKNIQGLGEAKNSSGKDWIGKEPPKRVRDKIGQLVKQQINAPANGSHPSSKVDPPQHTPKVDTDGVESLPQDSDLEWNLPCIANCYCGCSDCKKPGIPLTSEQMAILASHIPSSDRDDSESGQVGSTKELWLVNRLVRIGDVWLNPQQVVAVYEKTKDRTMVLVRYFDGQDDWRFEIEEPINQVVAALHGQEVENGSQ